MTSPFPPITSPAAPRDLSAFHAFHVAATPARVSSVSPVLLPSVCVSVPCVRLSPAPKCSSWRRGVRWVCACCLLCSPATASCSWTPRFRREYAERLLIPIASGVSGLRADAIVVVSHNSPPATPWSRLSAAEGRPGDGGWQTLAAGKSAHFFHSRFFRPFRTKTTRTYPYSRGRVFFPRATSRYLASEYQHHANAHGQQSVGIPAPQAQGRKLVPVSSAVRSQFHRD